MNSGIEMVIVRRIFKFAVCFAFTTFSVNASSNWDRMSWDWDDWSQPLFTQEDLTRELSEAEALKEEIIFRKDNEISDLKKELVDQGAVVDELNETIASLPGAAESTWDTMHWDEGKWFIEFDAIASEVDLRQAIDDAEAAGNFDNYILVNLNDVIAREEGEINNAIVDKDGDGLTDEQEISRGMDPNSYTIALESGWNLISLARIPDNNTTSQILGNQVLDTVWVWEENKFKVATELLPSRGHWVYAMIDTDVEIQLQISE